jgi:hypothetical protein
MASTRQELKWLIEDALNNSADAHGRIVQEQKVYRNQGHYDGRKRLGRVYSPAGESLYPKTTELIEKVKPRLESAAPRVDVSPDRSDRTEDEIDSVEHLEWWMDMYQDADNEGDKLRRWIHHNAVGGMGVRKVTWDSIHQRLNAKLISPLTFAPDPSCTEIDLSDALYLVHQNQHDTRYIKRTYPEFKIDKVAPKRVQGPNTFGGSQRSIQSFKVCEVWMRRIIAEEIGVDVSDTDAQMFVATMINDDLVKVRPTPYWYPDYPFVCWRNFIDYTDDGMPNSFWGFGLASLLWPQQAMLDYLLSNLVLILKNQAVGRVISPKGMLNLEQAWTLHGLNIEYSKQDGYNIADLLFLPPDQVPAALVDFVRFLIETMENISGIGPVLTGDAPFSGVSGRAVSALQSAALTHIGWMVRSLNEARLRLVRQQLVLIQQMAKRPLAPHLWRGGIDLPDRFPDTARHIGFALSIPDISDLPQTPAGKLQIAEFLAGAGAPLSLQKLLEFVGLDRGYGLQSEDFEAQIDPASVNVIPISDEVSMGREAGLRSEV